MFNPYGLLKFCCSCAQDASWWYWLNPFREYKTISAEGSSRNDSFASLMNQMPRILHKAIKKGPREFVCLYQKRSFGWNKHRMVCFLRPVKLPKSNNRNRPVGCCF
ncbi:unnamed protein product [Cylicocyclus nassatus]|uniref:Uncharacterized protein n=1 Tax=Cylicocyclus nassatus TaxID=53992 RepID=A0AA36DK29_CYLNA|nr:unnamed protein product [Cylicocyclus nassatus]